jgi:putative ABC transport system permease protein
VTEYARIQFLKLRRKLPIMKLAWNNLIHDRIRFAVTVLGIAFAVFLMIFQGSLLVSFLQAASKVIDATDAEIWIAARGVTCFDFSAPLPKRFVEIATGVPGVVETSRILTNFARFRKPDGHTQFVSIIGAEPGSGLEVYLPSSTGKVRIPDGVWIDESHAGLLGIGRFPQDVEINRRRSKVLGAVRGYSSFLGSPYVFTSYEDAAHYLEAPPEETTYILVKVANRKSIPSIQAELQRRLPNVDVMTRDEFARRSQLYWITQTGAGGAILTAAILGFIIGLVVASQTIYATTMEHLEEYATLKALGASRFYVMSVVVAQAVLCGAAGFTLGFFATQPAVELVAQTIAWLKTPSWLPWMMVPPGLLMCCLAALISIRAALNVEPARVFRA